MLRCVATNLIVVVVVSNAENKQQVHAACMQVFFRVTAVQSQRSETQAKLASWVVDRDVRDFPTWEEKSRWLA